MSLKHTLDSHLNTENSPNYSNVTPVSVAKHVSSLHVVKESLPSAENTLTANRISAPLQLLAQMKFVGRNVYMNLKWNSSAVYLMMAVTFPMTQCKVAKASFMTSKDVVGELD